MWNKLLLLRPFALAVAMAVCVATAGFAGIQESKPKLDSPDARDMRRTEVLRDEVRHQLVTLPYYSVFDWLEANVTPDGTVTLSGQVTRPTLKDDAGDRVEKIESATRVVNNIEVLPLSTMDDELRVAVYRALFRFNSPLFRYGTQSVPPIHIIVKNGRLTLKGIVQSQFDSQYAETTARSVSGLFEVKNELQIEQQVDQKVTSRQ
jgi:hyperosmotically inducible protein